MNWRALLKSCAGFSLLGSLAYFMVTTLRWPLVNDAALMHYVVFLLEHGMAPYRDVGDINLPGTYFVEWVVMHTLGGGALAWRIFDLLLLTSAGVAMIAIARRYSWFGGVLAAVLFALFHGRDGAGQLGQRDLTMAVALLLSCAFVFAAVRQQRWALMLPFGVLSGLAVTIKPTGVLFFLFLLLMSAIELHRQRRSLLKYGVSAVVGLFLPLLAGVLFLLREHAVSAFLSTVTGEIIYHASVGNRGLRYLFNASLTPSVLTLVALAGIIALLRRDWHRWEMTALLGCAFLGWISFLLQGKGYPYHRYPVLAFLMLWMGIEFGEASRIPNQFWIRSLGVAGVLYGSFALAPIYAVRAQKAHWNQEMLVSLEQDLTRLGGSQLSGHIQCIDSISGCTNALYDMRLMQATGTIYDEFLFGAADNPVILRNQNRFLSAIQKHPPQVIVVTDPLFPTGPDGYNKLKLWPVFERYLAANHRVITQRSFAPGGTGRLGYRLYIANSLVADAREP